MLKQFLNSLEDYCVLCEKYGDKLIPILINKNEKIDFYPIDNSNKWFQYESDYYELIENKMNIQGIEYYLFQYHKNNELFKRIQKSNTDSLTQLPTREKINQYLSRINKDISFCTFGIIDIDFFKHINDTKGHLYGDQILSEIGAILNMNKDCFDCIGRYGGEEFFFSIENKSIDEVLPFIEKMKEKIEEYFTTNKLTLTISIGISSYNKGDAVFDRIEEADKALYYVKEHQRDNIAYKNEYNEYILLNPIEENVRSI